MGKKARTASEAEIKDLYREDYFYEHGSNPAYKKLNEICAENLYEGNTPEYRSVIKDNRARGILALTWESFMINQCKAYTATRAAACWVVSTMILNQAVGFSRAHLPIGQHGIRSFRQTQVFRLYGAAPVVGLCAIPILAGWAWLNISVWAGKMVYNHAIMGDRNWIHEHMRWNHGNQNYYFNDSPMSCDESFPEEARGEMAKIPKETLIATPEDMKR